ncbi:MAG: class I SAM-dependent DNA methyltransferase, partial [Syntrophales bacterium LBB04]|nr:class I SAM-dependent DNA methyltransferase [Syntrophales bacterium LBB04]
VAIDPEMLGKVFEKLLEVKERKSKGSFYTPREIVHYMCQESLINYLDTSVNIHEESLAPDKPKQPSLFGNSETEQMTMQTTIRKELVPRTDIETFIHSGDQASYYEAARMGGTKSYSRQLPKTIQTHSRLLDEKLAEIAVCDPAIGSGAFPVGMMQEIVRARSSLTPYFNDFHERTAYHFKRHAIQNCLYGVDIDPGAVEIAKLRLWLSLVVDEEETNQIKPLPNLDYKIVAGNSLMGFPFKSQRLKDIEKLKTRFFDEPDHDVKAKLKRQIESELATCFASSKKNLGTHCFQILK